MVEREERKTNDDTRGRSPLNSGKQRGDCAPARVEGRGKRRAASFGPISKMTYWLGTCKIGSRLAQSIQGKSFLAGLRMLWKMPDSLHACLGRGNGTIPQTPSLSSAALNGLTVCKRHWVIRVGCCDWAAARVGMIQSRQQKQQKCS